VKNNYGIPLGPTVQLSQNNKRRKPTFQTFTTVDDSPWLDSFMAMEVWSPGPPRLWLVAVEVIDSHGVTQLCAVLHGGPPWFFFFFCKKNIYVRMIVLSYDFCLLFDEKVDRSLAFTLRPNTGIKSIKLETGVLMSKSPKAHRGLLLIFL